MTVNSPSNACQTQKTYSEDKKSTPRLGGYEFEVVLGFLTSAVSDKDAPYTLINSAVKASKELTKVFQYYQKKNIEARINVALEKPEQA